MSFLANLQKNIEEINSLKLTENGAIGYSTTGKKLLDMNFNVASYRKCGESEITSDFDLARAENEVLAILWAFFVRDVRGGLGERRLFRVLFRHLIGVNSEAAGKLLPLISEYGRWDDLIKTTVNTQLWIPAVEIIKNQLTADHENYSAGKPISLLAKWMPSERTSSQDTRKLARKLADSLGMDIKAYNRTLSALRNHLKIVESKMSAKEWSEIDYSAVPSKANLIYNNAFLRNDEERRRAYLGALSRGEAKINAGTLFPHDVVHKYCRNSGWSCNIGNKIDPALEEMWKALPDSKGLNNVIVVADGSGSMTTCVDNQSSVTALNIANALAIYCAERCKGEFKDKYITFSARPKFVDFSGCNTLRDKIAMALRYNEVANTNIEAVFQIILDTAVSNGYTQSEIPQSILIISDMEFDSATSMGRYSYSSMGRYSYYNSDYSRETLFGSIEKKYARHGLKLPRLVFWNVASRTKTIPIKENDLGVTLVSGFSTGIMQMVTNGQTDPYLNLVETITGKRYQPVLDALK